MKKNILMPIMTFMTRFYNNPINIKSSYSLNTLFLIVFTGFLFILNSCEEEGTMIGKNLLPGGDFVSFYSTDTISVYSYTIFSDSLESDNPGYVFLGQIYDPYFGTTTAGFVSQLRLFSQWDYELYTVDSVELSLTFANVTGNVMSGHILKISEIAEQIYPDSIYYSSQQVPVTGFSVEVPLPELQADTINNIVLDLPVSFGEYLVRDTTMLFYSESGDEPDFMSYFKGIYFQLVSSGDPVLITLNLEPLAADEFYRHYLSIYLHDEENISSTLILVIDAKGTKNAAFSTFRHDFSTAEPGKQILHVNDGVRDSLSYVQCLNGIYTKLAVPGLEKIKEDPSFDGIYLNKARIICPVYYDGDEYTGSSFPSQLYMGYYNNLGQRYVVPDYYINSSIYNGKIDTTAGNYTVNIASYIQLYLDDSTSTYRPEFQLALPQGSLKNAILRANDSSRPVKFELTYTRF
jgi:hypothetical protein